MGDGSAMRFLSWNDHGKRGREPSLASRRTCSFSSSAQPRITATVRSKSAMQEMPDGEFRRAKAREELQRIERQVEMSDAVERDEFGQRDRCETVADARRELFQDRQRLAEIVRQRFVQADGGLAHALHDAEPVEPGRRQLHEALLRRSPGQIAAVSAAKCLRRSRLKISFSAGAAPVEFGAEFAMVASSSWGRKLHASAAKDCQENSTVRCNGLRRDLLRAAGMTRLALGGALIEFAHDPAGGGLEHEG